MPRWSIVLGTVFVLLVGLALAVLPALAERQANRVAPHDRVEISPAAKRLHDTLTIADLHSDTLLWARDPLDRGDRGHVDLPRLREGNVAIQVFPSVTKAPAGQNYDSNSADSDMITGLVMLQRWPPRTWTSLLERALYQAERLHEAQARAPEQMSIVRSRGDLDRVLAERRNGSERLAAILATEGLHPLEGELANLRKLWDAGFRILGLQHFFDNELGGSLHGESKSGLTPFGEQVIREMDELGLIVDVAHSAPAVVDDVLRISPRPFLVSHTGVYGACESARNLDDARMKKIAERGGLIGIGYWDGAVCDPTPAGVVRAIRYAIGLLGIEHVALGSDYDGATQVHFDTFELAVLTEEMLRQGFHGAEIRAVMGGNVARFLREWLPSETR